MVIELLPCVVSVLVLGCVDQGIICMSVFLVFVVLFVAFVSSGVRGGGSFIGCSEEGTSCSHALEWWKSCRWTSLAYCVFRLGGRGGSSLECSWVDSCRWQSFPSYHDNVNEEVRQLVRDLGRGTIVSSFSGSGIGEVNSGFLWCLRVVGISALFRFF